MSILIKGMEMPKKIEPGLVVEFAEGIDGKRYARLHHYRYGGLTDWLEAVAVTEHGRLKKRVVYRGEVYSAIEAARINALDGILTDRYKDGYHDGLKRALEILANEVEDAPTIIPASEEGDT